MASVYILYSEKLDKFYVGSCNEVLYRIEQHLNKDFSGSFTSRAEDWELFWKADDLDYQQARAIETHIKKMKNRKYYHDLKRYPEIIQKLKGRYGGWRPR